MNWLRFVLALYLVLYHTLRVNYPAIEGSWFKAALSLGNMATSIFFMLSGFLLMHAYVVLKNGRHIDKGNFLVARFSTLYPLHIAGLLLSIGPVAITFFVSGGVTVNLDGVGSAVRTAEKWEVMLALFMTIMLLNAWNPFYLIFNGPSWSLSALGFYYLLFPAIASKIYRMKALKGALVLCGILFFLPGALADIFHRTDLLTQGVLHRNPIIRLPLFIAGMVMCVLFAQGTKSVSTRQWAGCCMLIIGTVAAAAMLKFHEISAHMIKNGMFFPASLAVIWLCACVKQTQNSSIRYWGDRLGAASLPLFLLHIPIFVLFRKAEQILMVLPSTSGGLSTALHAARQADQSIVFYPLYVILLVTLCILVQERFVVPMQKAIRNRFSNRGAALTSLANAAQQQSEDRKRATA